MPIRSIFIQSLRALSLLTLLGLGVGAAQAEHGNTVFGTGAGASLGQNAHWNTLLGENAGNASTAATSNTLVGYEAGLSLKGTNPVPGGNPFLGDGNTMVGRAAGRQTTTGFFNTFFGYLAGFNTTTGCCNTFLGENAGFNNLTGFRNVFVGRSAGGNELGSNKLYIDNNASSFPLIYGEFDNDLVGINGALGVGTQIPMDQLHVRDGNLRIEQTGATHALLNFIANGKTWEIKNNEATGRLTFFSPGGGATTAPFKFDRQAVENLLRVGVLAPDTVDISGNLVVTGNISNPDYIFTPEYELESIEAHAAYMWEHHHLPAVGAGQVNAQGQAMVNVGARSQGVLEELELAHIYIDQLHQEKTQTETELAALKADRTYNGNQLAALTQDVTALKAKKAELAVVKKQMTEKVAEVATLEGEMAALEALVGHLIDQTGDTTPGEED